MTGQTPTGRDDGAAAREERNLLYSACRWIAALILVQYGFAKLFGAQFTVLDSELDKPMGTVSGFWLTWYYFGYSPIFGNLLALLQIGLGLALAFRRTALLGAAGTAPLLGGISVLNLSYGIALDALVVSLIGAGCAGYVLWRHRRELKAVFWDDRAASGARPRWVRAVLVVLLLAVPASCSYYVANYNNRAPTALDGTWEVTAGDFRPPGLPGPAERAYFEHNRAHQLVLRSGWTWQTHHFEVDPAARAIGVWRTWLRKDEQLLSGRYDLTGDRLVITATDPASGRPLRWELRRVPPGQLRRSL
ncbi:hypothetical protein ACFFMN_30725 [Planobispora siamensis]|uniref:DoxX family protein n=1 Tax=Planobispora siamensis TaxID=936338 RepID=A0A8J3SF28_9ACTN|nr:hypothetical protein [Planobispora siamensis]GIH91431.1 hypothetical protein Psi01_20610 [Planobispora siamensis]